MQQPDGFVWPAIIGYEIPLDDPGVVSDILSPATRSYRFLSAAEYKVEYGVPKPFNSSYVLQWYDYEWPADKMIVPDGYNHTFGTAEYEPFSKPS